MLRGYPSRPDDAPDMRGFNPGGIHEPGWQATFGDPHVW